MTWLQFQRRSLSSSFPTCTIRNLWHFSALTRLWKSTFQWRGVSSTSVETHRLKDRRQRPLVNAVEQALKVRGPRWRSLVRNALSGTSVTFSFFVRVFSRVFSLCLCLSHPSRVIRNICGTQTYGVALPHSPMSEAHGDFYLKIFASHIHFMSAQTEPFRGQRFSVMLFKQRCKLGYEQEVSSALHYSFPFLRSCFPL